MLVRCVKEQQETTDDRFSSRTVSAVSPRQALRQLMVKLLAHYRPLYPCELEARRDPLTLSDIKEACGWLQILEQGRVPHGSDPLAVAQLRVSNLFPGQLLWTRDDAKVVVVDMDEAVQIIYAAAEQYVPQSRLPS